MGTRHDTVTFIWGLRVSPACGNPFGPCTPWPGTNNNNGNRAWYLQLGAVRIFHMRASFWSFHPPATEQTTTIMGTRHGAVTFVGGLRGSPARRNPSGPCTPWPGTNNNNGNQARYLRVWASRISHVQASFRSFHPLGQGTNKQQWEPVTVPSFRGFKDLPHAGIRLVLSHPGLGTIIETMISIITRVIF
jgi:hypothetical protein